MARLLAMLAALLLAVPAGSAKPKKSAGSKRAASGGAKGSSRKAAKSSGGGAKSAPKSASGPKKPAGKGGKKGKKEADPAEARLSDPNDPAPCMRSGLPRLLAKAVDGDEDGVGEASAGACGFLLPDDIAKTVKPDSFLCVYNTRSSGKADSVYNYYLTQNYGITENSVKEGSSVVNVRYKKKGLYAYYKFLSDELASGGLKESAIFDQLAEDILERNEIPADQEAAIENKSVESVELSLDITKSAMEACAAAVRDIDAECGEMSSPEAKKAVEASCLAYDSALTKRAGDMRVKALSQDSKLLEALLQRSAAGANIDAIILNAKEKQADNKERKAAVDARLKDPEPEDDIEESMRKAEELKARMDAADSSGPSPDAAAPDPGPGQENPKD